MAGDTPGGHLGCAAAVSRTPSFTYFFLNVRSREAGKSAELISSVGCVLKINSYLRKIMFIPPIDSPAIPAVADKVFGLTSTEWTALGTIFSAISVLALVIFNAIYLRRVHQQSDAAIEQAKLARESLETLQVQIKAQSDTELHTAYAILHQTAWDVSHWRQAVQREIRAVNERVELVPDDWKVLVSYVSRHKSYLRPKIGELSMKLRQAESTLNSLLKSPLADRNGNTSTQQIMKSLMKSLGECDVILIDVRESFEV
jgi:membrane protein implicated in regulation of membrane protease activity